MTTVLVASADGELRRLAAVELAQGGHQSLLSPDPIEAMQLITGGGAGAAVVDMELPPPGGEALVERIRSEEACRQMPVLSVLRRDDAAGGVAGEVLARPLTRLVVGAALGRLLSGAAVRRPAGESGEAGSVPGARKVRALCHDLNNPLAVAMGQLEIIAERYSDLPDDLKRRLKEVERAAESIKKLIREAGAEARGVSEAGGE